VCSRRGKWGAFAIEETSGGVVVGSKERALMTVVGAGCLMQHQRERVNKGEVNKKPRNCK
jgi:hypothetical protein